MSVLSGSATVSRGTSFRRVEYVEEIRDERIHAAGAVQDLLERGVIFLAELFSQTAGEYLTGEEYAPQGLLQIMGGDVREGLQVVIGLLQLVIQLRESLFLALDHGLPARELRKDVHFSAHDRGFQWLEEKVHRALLVPAEHDRGVVSGTR